MRLTEDQENMLKSLYKRQHFTMKRFGTNSWYPAGCLCAPGSVATSLFKKGLIERKPGNKNYSAYYVYRLLKPGVRAIKAETRNNIRRDIQRAFAG